MTPSELEQKWGRVLSQAAHIWTWTEPYNLAYCAEVASRSDSGVEIGSYLGASAFVMLAANPNLHLWCVDIFNVAGIQRCCEYFLRPFIDAGRCEIIVGDSARAGEMLVHMKGKLDFVWVDDGHAEEDVLRDIKSFHPLLKIGGEMFGHDFEVPHNDVARGVIRSGVKYTVPVPRLWSHIKKSEKCCGR